MPLHIIIDGYNLIGSVAGLRGNLEARRDRLIRELGEYQEKKGYPITVVFDGWRSGWINEVEERIDRIHVVYSKQGEKADSVILRLAREMGSGCVVVSSDREVRSGAEACGAVPVYAGEFRAKLGQPASANSAEDDEGLKGLRVERKRGNPRKLSKRERRKRERLRKL
ncbi:MAG: NYN domain-containing protein [Deltaproteobacteria bacterium]|nr:NYN domain-containing protein [Deltaproteobacteria bacterium]